LSSSSPGYPAGAFTDLELVEIQIAERMLGVAAARTLDRLFSPNSNIAAVDTGVTDHAAPGRPSAADHIAQGGDIVQHQQPAPITLSAWLRIGRQ